MRLTKFSKRYIHFFVVSKLVYIFHIHLNLGVHGRTTDRWIYFWWHHADPFVAFCSTESSRAHPPINPCHARTRYGRITVKKCHKTGSHKHYSQLPQGMLFIEIKNNKTCNCKISYQAQVNSTVPNLYALFTAVCNPRAHARTNVKA